MSLYIVHRKNDYYPLNTYLEDGDDGYVQPVRVVYSEGRANPAGFYGIMVLERDMRPYMVKVLRKGYDFRRESLGILS